jgi:hypothetical protein
MYMHEYMYIYVNVYIYTQESFNHVAKEVLSLEKSRYFYVEILGFTVLPRYIYMLMYVYISILYVYTYIIYTCICI